MNSFRGIVQNKDGGFTLHFWPANQPEFIEISASAARTISTYVSNAPYVEESEPKRKRSPRVYITCCDKKQVAHQYPKGSGDYKINCNQCSTEIWGDPAHDFDVRGCWE